MGDSTDGSSSIPVLNMVALYTALGGHSSLLIMKSWITTLGYTTVCRAFSLTWSSMRPGCIVFDLIDTGHIHLSSVLCKHDLHDLTLSARP